MGYKKYRTTIGSEKNRKEYFEHTPYCEICGSTYETAVHHHIPQQWKYRGDEYIIDLPENYSTLCRTCHGIVEHNESQYDRELFGRVFNGRLNWVQWRYWKTLKNGKKPEEYVEGEVN
jgi:hypothetical protein